jgi:hypothetical protein
MEYSYREITVEALNPLDAIREFTERQRDYQNDAVEFDRAYAHITDIECLEGES